MGQFVAAQHFKQDAFDRFTYRLRKESAQLAHWLDDGHFTDTERKIGLEVEGWLIDDQGQPAAANESMLAAVDDPLIVPELSQYNFEINTLPLDGHGNALNLMQRQLDATWAKISHHCEKLGLRSLLIGSLPNLRDSHLNLESMSREDRYRLLNEQIMRLRQNNPIRLHIEGLEELDITHNDVMLEAASTSVQVHLQVPLRDYCKYFNASILASPLTVAAAANAPYVFGRQLWEETRIPVFERSLALPGFQDISGYLIQRVNFGSGFLRQSAMSCFLENLDGYPVLMPLTDETKPIEDLYHLKLHNGTIWRWNRPILGKNAAGEATIRIEHRVMSAGPSIRDIVGNVAFYLGLVAYFVDRIEKDPDILSNFDRTRQNFYQAARYGLQAPYIDEKQQTGTLAAYMDSKFLAKIKAALHTFDYDAADINHYFDEVIGPRIEHAKTGAAYQKSRFSAHGNHQQLIDEYHHLQQSGRPVWDW